MTKTNAYTLLCVAIRAVVVWVAATSLVGLPLAIHAARSGASDGPSGWLMLLAAGVIFSVLALVWLFADKLAKLALSRPQDPAFESNLEPREWLGLAISIIGAWFLFVALKDGAYLSIRWIAISRTTQGSLTLDNGLGELLPDAIALVIEVGLAMGFLLRGPGIANLIHRWRYGHLVAKSAGSADS
jgi:hypothetical protein